MTVTINSYNQITEDVLRSILSLEDTIFDTPFSEKKIKARLSSVKDSLILVASLKGDLAAFKIGYQHPDNSTCFYSWIGGVAPKFRRMGLAKALMEEQHKRAREAGYTMVRTKTKNTFREMLLLNIRFGFDIVAVTKQTSDDGPSIILEKHLDINTSAN